MRLPSHSVRRTEWAGMCITPRGTSKSEGERSAFRAAAVKAMKAASLAACDYAMKAVKASSSLSQPSVSPQHRMWVRCHRCCSSDGREGGFTPGRSLRGDGREGGFLCRHSLSNEGREGGFLPARVEAMTAGKVASCPAQAEAMTAGKAASCPARAEAMTAGKVASSSTRTSVRGSARLLPHRGSQAARGLEGAVKAHETLH